jgi:NhaA family Na+:H+ antiporter
VNNRPLPTTGADGGPEQGARGLRRWVRPLVEFLHVEASSGVVLLLSAVLALVVANYQPGRSHLEAWAAIPLDITLGTFAVETHLGHLVHFLINDGLMTIFFFVVGLEIKRELVAGELREPRKAALPALAALGGMIVPAVIYLALRLGKAGERGWGVPVATDIAFVVGFLALFGNRVPSGLKILLLSLAIVDDIGAVLVIAIFYTEDLSLLPLGIAACLFVLIVVCGQAGVRDVTFYSVIGVCIWGLFLWAHIHPTVAGVVLGLLTPASALLGKETMQRTLCDVHDLLEHRPEEGQGYPVEIDRDEELRWHRAMGELAYAAREAVSPLERLEVRLHPWVAFAIMPLFALANAGVHIQPEALRQEDAAGVAGAVILGLVVGKPLGIVVWSALAVVLGLGRLPEGVDWKAMWGAGCLGGIGFTMSLFIAALGFQNEQMLAAGKVGILVGSGSSALLGCALLCWFLPARPALQAEKAGNGPSDPST